MPAWLNGDQVGPVKVQRLGGKSLAVSTRPYELVIYPTLTLGTLQGVSALEENICRTSRNEISHAAAPSGSSGATS